MHAESKPTVMFVLEESPCPPRDSGFTIRYWPLLQQLARLFCLDLVLILEADAAAPQLGNLGATINRLILVRKAGPPSVGERLVAQIRRILPMGIPFDKHRYGVDVVVNQIFNYHPESYGTVVWATYSAYSSRFISRYRGDNLVVDAIDSVALWKASESAHIRWLGRIRLSKARRWERSLCRRVRKTFFVAPVDAGVIAPYVEPGRVQVMPNGVYFDDYHAGSANLAGPSIGYLGNMSYEPNIDAAHRLRRVFELLKKDVPDLKLYIIGRDPDASILDFRKNPDITVTGTVNDIWCYVNAIDVFVLPVFLGAGLQNKLLEVLYAGKPAVVSSVANRGVRADEDACVIMADSELEMAQAALALLEQPALRDSLGCAGRKFVERNFSWDAIAKRYASALQEA